MPRQSAFQSLLVPFALAIVLALPTQIRAGEVDLSGQTKAIDDTSKAVSDAKAAADKAKTNNPPPADQQAAEDQADKDAADEAKAKDAVDKASAAKEAAKTAKDIKDANKAYDDAAKALGPAIKKAKESEAAAKKTAKGSKYHDAKEKEREARRLLSGALSRLRTAIRDARRNGNKIKDEAEARGREATGAGTLGVGSMPLSALVFIPDDHTALAALVRDGKLDAVATGTGETIGFVANVTLHNKTAQPLVVVIPPTVLVSTDGKTQSYGVPTPTQVALKPGETKTVPLDGVCTQAHKPPAGNKMPGNLMIADPKDPTFDVAYRPQLSCTQDVIQTVESLQHDGQIHTPFQRDPTKEFQTVVQQTIWAANPSHDGRATTKEDLANKVYEQVGAKTDEDKKKLQPGIDSIWDAVQLTGAKAKVFNVDNGTGDGSGTNTPGAGGDTTGTTQAAAKPPFTPPPGSKDAGESTDPKGNRVITYTDSSGNIHTITIDGKNHAVETTEKDGKAIGTRSYDVEFNPKTGGRTETEVTKSGSSTTTTEVEYNGKGVIVRSTEATMTEGNTAEKPSTQTIKETKYDDNHVKTESSETNMTYGYDEDFQPAATKGKRTTTKYSGKDDKKGTTTKEKYNPQTGNFDPE